MNNAHKLITILGGKNTQLYVKITPIDSGDEGNLQTHLDLSAQAIDAVTAERDEARAWARRMKRERDELQRQLDEEKNKVNYIYRIGFTLPPGKWFVGGPSG